MHVTPPPWPPKSGASRAVALEILRYGPLSRSEVARRLDLSQGSLTRLSTPLLESGLLAEADEQPTGRVGRGSRPLDVVAESHHFVGIKLTGDRAFGVATNLRSEVAAEADVPLTSRDPIAVAETLASLTRHLADRVPSVTALGIGLGGLVVDSNIVARAPFLDWVDVPLGTLVEERAGLPTVVENDLTALTQFEHWFGAGQGLDRFAILTLGAAIGYGTVIHDQIVLGPDSGVGLVGHWPLDPLGPLCPDGHRGCAQSLLAMPSIARQLSEALDTPVDYDTSLDLADAGDPAARAIANQAGRGLGRLIAAVANLTLAERILIGGEGARLAEVARDAVNEGIRADRDRRASPVDVVVNLADTRKWCRGAAVLAIQTYVLGMAGGEI